MDSSSGIESQQQFSQTKLDTNYCCFLCLTVTDIKTEELNGEENNQSSDEDENNVENRETVNLKSLQRYLKIDTEKLSKSSQVLSSGGNSAVVTDNGFTTPPLSDRDNIEVDLCKSCGRIVTKVSELISSLERIQMQVDYWMGRIHRQISETSENSSELVENYTKRMTTNGDAKSLSQLTFADKLRKEIAKKSLERKPEFEPAKINLLRLETLPKHEIPSESEDAAHSSQPEEESRDPYDSYPSSDYEEEEDWKPELNQTSSSDEEDEEGQTEHRSPSNPQQTKKAAVLSPSPSKSLPEQIYVKNSKTGTVDCTACEKTFRSTLSARRHYQSAHLNIRYECDICHSSYTSPHMLKFHQKRCNGVKRTMHAKHGTKWLRYDPNNGKYTCLECNKQFNSKGYVRTHYYRIHVPQKLNKCSKCNLVFKHKHSLAAHKKKKSCETTAAHLRQARKKRKEGNPAKYKASCETCGEKFKSAFYVKRHQDAVHLKKKNFACDLCEERFIYPISLRLHKNSIHLGIWYECVEDCEKRFSGKRQLKAHQKKCSKLAEVKQETESISADETVGD